MEVFQKDIDLIIFITIFLVVFMLAFLGFIFYYLKKFYRYELEKKQMKLEFDNEITAVQMEIQEQTLQHISREIHDNLGHIASLIKINLHTLQLDEKEAAIQKISTTKELSRRLIGDIKSISVRLGNDKFSEIGFIKSIENELADINKTGVFDTTLTIGGDLPEIDNNKALILYRMSQEILNNTIKHSNAKHIDIDIQSRPSSIDLSFKDDGDGFDMQDKLINGGSGLRNLQNRARMIQADIKMESALGKGSSVHIHLPI